MAETEPGDSAGRPPGEGHTQPEGGIFAKLPRSRPGVRSPSRESSAATTAPKPADTRTERPPPKATGTAPPPRRAAPAPESPTDAPADRDGGLGDAAWAGVATVAEAATLGVRLASRALEAVRGAVERR